VLCILAKKSESTVIFRLIKMIDPHAFVSQSSVIGVFGEGFDQIKVKVKPPTEPTPPTKPTKPTEPTPPTKPTKPTP
jgi:hypothetical protein